MKTDRSYSQTHELNLVLSSLSTDRLFPDWRVSQISALLAYCNSFGAEGVSGLLLDNPALAKNLQEIAQVLQGRT